MRRITKGILVVGALFAILGITAIPSASAQSKKPNIVAIMGDDIGMWNIGAYHRGVHIVANKTKKMFSEVVNLILIAASPSVLFGYQAAGSASAENT